MITNDNKPDYTFDANLKAESKIDVLCDVAIWLPKDADENMRIEIESPEKVNIIENLMGDFISIESEAYDNQSKFVAKCSKARIKQIFAQIDSRKLARAKIQLLHAWDLTISEKIGSKEDAFDSETTIYFQLGALLYAQPDTCVVPDYLGSREVKIGKNYTGQRNEGYEFKIEKHYSGYKNISQNKEVVSSQNVISVVSKNITKVGEIDTVVKETNDFALLLSFAARHQVIVLGYEYRTENRRVRHYKNPTDRYKTRLEENVEDALIPLQSFELFMNGALDSWYSADVDVRSAIKGAILSIHPMNDSHQSYLDMFSAFEGLVNSSMTSKTSIGLELDNKWDDIEQSFNACIDSQHVSESAKIFLKCDITGIRNREKFRNRAESYLAELNLDVSDLWPIFEGVSLYRIRNRLAHGRRMKLDPIYRIAQEQLQLLLERLVLKLLGFNCNESAAGLNNYGIRSRCSQQDIIKFQNQLEASK